MVFKFVISGCLPSLNEYIKAINNSKYGGNSMKRNSEKIITAYIKKQLGNTKIKKPVFINLLWVETSKRRDKDNIAFAKKFIFDALVANKTLQNDGWANVVGFTDNFDIDRKNPRIEVTITEIHDK